METNKYVVPESGKYLINGEIKELKPNDIINMETNKEIPTAEEVFKNSKYEDEIVDRYKDWLQLHLSRKAEAIQELHDKYGYFQGDNWVVLKRLFKDLK